MWKYIMAAAALKVGVNCNFTIQLVHIEILAVDLFAMRVSM